MILLPKTNRIEVVDAMRGFAIMAIMLIHHLEHFNYYFSPKTLPAWMKALDAKIWGTVFFLFSGKAYAILALLFGFTFYIQFSNQQDNGYDFCGRFVWRLALLLLFGTLNSLFYNSDILGIFAILGLTLIPVRNLSNKWIIGIVVFLLIQPYELTQIIISLIYPEYVPPRYLTEFYSSKILPCYSSPSFIVLIKGNIYSGRMAVLWWLWEHGRIFQIPALFMLGMVLGRNGWFVSTELTKKYWRYVFIISVTAFMALWVFDWSLRNFVIHKGILESEKRIINTLNNLAITMCWVSIFMELFKSKLLYRLLNKLVPLGKMSLTNYIIQSVTGSLIYYGYCGGLYQYTGALYCMLIGITLIILQLMFSRLWLTCHKQGPLESLWHKGTWLCLRGCEKRYPKQDSFNG